MRDASLFALALCATRRSVVRAHVWHIDFVCLTTLAHLRYLLCPHTNRNVGWARCSGHKTRPLTTLFCRFLISVHHDNQFVSFVSAILYLCDTNIRFRSIWLRPVGQSPWIALNCLRARAPRAVRKCVYTLHRDGLYCFLITSMRRCDSGQFVVSRAACGTGINTKKIQSWSHIRDNTPMACSSYTIGWAERHDTTILFSKIQIYYFARHKVWPLSIAVQLS